jgi:D-alanyl-D-alanine carboxypeptidase
MIRSTTSNRSRRLAGSAVAVSVCAAIGLAACAGPGDDDVDGARDATTISAGTTRQLADLMQQEVDGGVPGVVVRIDDGSGSPVSIVKQAAWSVSHHALAADDQFRMGSNTKPMTATLILQLVDEHKLSLDDPAEKWLPGMIPNGASITIRMLLNHTSGLFDYALDPAGIALETGTTPPVSHADLMTITAQNPPVNAPGAAWSYSNGNYIALGLILEKITGKDAATLLQERIAEPLGMHDTYLAMDGISRDGARLAQGYEPDAAHLKPLLPPGTPDGVGFAGHPMGDHVVTTDNNPDWSWTAGSIVSTQADEQRFLRGLMSGELISHELLTQMRDAVVETPSDPNSPRYGLGLEQYESPCGPVWGHTGGIPGYGSYNYTDETGSRAVSEVTTSLFAMHDPALAAKDKKVIDGAICAMLGKPLPAPAG